MRRPTEGAELPAIVIDVGRLGGLPVSSGINFPLGLVVQADNR